MPETVQLVQLHSHFVTSVMRQPRGVHNRTDLRGEKLHPARMNHDRIEETIIEVCCLLDEQTRLLDSQTKMTDMSVERCGDT